MTVIRRVLRYVKYDHNRFSLPLISAHLTEINLSLDLSLFI